MDLNCSPNNQKLSTQYRHKDLYELLNEMTKRLELFQFVEFNTWEKSNTKFKQYINSRPHLCERLQYNQQLKIGKNIATNRLVTLNNKTSLNELPNFKIKIKALFLNLGNG